MKNILFLFILTANFISYSSYSQNWQAVTSNTTDAIKDMFFQNENTGFAVVGQGKILKTTDGGENWNLIYENSELYQEQSIVATNDKVFCFGQNFQGQIKILNFTIALNDFSLTTSTALFGVPQKLVYYNNLIFGNGFQYVDGNIINLNGLPTDIYEINNNINNLSTSNGHSIYHSNNGVLWNISQFHLPFLSSNPYQSYYDGLNKMRTVTNYPCVVHISNDNGFSWTFNQTNVQALYFYFIDAEKVLGLYLFSELSPQNKIYYSTDSGINFDFETVANPVKKIYKYNNNLIFAYGGNGVIYKSSNAGGLLDIIDIKKKEININVYPNPTKNGEINISYNKDELQINTLSIVNSLGAEIKFLRDNFGIISTSGFSDGVYFLKFDTNKGIITKKIILKN
jgi:hypothetical protein